MLPSAERDHLWPALPYQEWQETAQTLHLWTQIIGKIRLTLTPWINHSWHVTYYVTSRGLTTSPIPHGSHSFEMQFDFISHELQILKSDGLTRLIKLQPQSVATFYQRVMTALKELNLEVKINRLPNELVEPIRFDRDEVHRSYDPEYVNRFWRILSQSNRVFQIFRAQFCGKSSPIHFFWGSFDLAVSRFSGRTAPPHPGGIPHLPDRVAREAYSHEVFSLGFWPGDTSAPTPVFYAYVYPEPAGFAQAPARPKEASYSPVFREFMLPYDAVRQADSPDDVLLDFAGSLYDAASHLGKWDRQALAEATFTT